MSSTRRSDRTAGQSAIGGDAVETVRAFNRFWTDQIGLLRSGLLDTPYSLTEARFLFETAQRERTELADLRRVLDLDAGYLSRILKRFESDGLVETSAMPQDARRKVLQLTEHGRRTFDDLNERSVDQVEGMLAGLPAEDRDRLLAAMRTIQEVFADRHPREPFVIRGLLPGDLGWIVHRHGIVYADEYGWNEEFEALVARVVADYAADHDPRRENAWIAEVDGEPVGCVLCVRKSDTVAQLRLLLVEPKTRGLGIGARLVAECVRFATRAGYEHLVLWTNDVLTAARRIYEAAGFELVDEHEHHSFGHDLIGQNWSLDLRRARTGRGS